MFFQQSETRNSDFILKINTAIFQNKHISSVLNLTEIKLTINQDTCIYNLLSEDLYPYSIMMGGYSKLTEQQAAYLQKLLPKGYSFQAVQFEEKRNRTKKVDDTYLMEYITSPRIKKAPESQRSIKEVKSLPVLPNSSKSIVLQVEPGQQPKLKPNFNQKKQASKPKKAILNDQSMSKILSKLIAHKSSWPFRVPVDPIGQNVPNYLEIIKQPMDLRTIEKKIKSGQYNSRKQFNLDIEKIITNSYAFNPKDTTYYTHTRQFQAYYTKVCQEYNENPVGFIQWQKQNQEKDQYISQVGSPKKIEKAEALSLKKSQKMQKQMEQSSSHEKQKEPPMTTVGPKRQNKERLTLANQLSLQEREKIFSKISKLSQDKIPLLVQLVFGNNMQKDWKEVELELKVLSDEKFIQLQECLKQP